MIPGDRFAIGNPCSLYCECIHVYEDGGIHGRVINGAWEFHFAPHSGVMRWNSPTGPDKALVSISYLGPWPHTLRDYNEAISFVEAQLKRPKIVRWGLSLLWTTQALARRFKKALRAFQASWKGLPDSDLEDRIPF